MAVLTTGNTFANGDQVTASSLNNAVNDAVFASGAVDSISTQLAGSGAIIVKDLGIDTGKIATGAVTTAKLASNSVSTAKIIDSNVTKAKIENFTNLTVLGNVSGSSAAPAEVTILDEDNMVSDSATSLATQQSIKAYADSKVDGTGAGAFTTLTASDDVNFDSGTLFVDASADSVGIGTTSPAQTLDVNGGARVVGNLFVGTDDTTPNGMIEVYGGGTGQYEGGEIRIRTAADFDSTYNHYFIDTYQDDLRIGRALNTDITLTSAGNVGIGTSSPGSLLNLRLDNSTAFDATDDEGQRASTASLLIQNEDGTNGSFSQIVFDTAGTSQSIARIAAIRTASGSNDLAFVVEGSNVKREAMRISSSGNVGIGTTVPNSILEISSTTSGVIMPRMNTTEMNAISSPTNGEMIYNTSVNKFYGYANGAWVALH